jgi:hypothetical protein
VLHRQRRRRAPHVQRRRHAPPRRLRPARYCPPRQRIPHSTQQPRGVLNAFDDVADNIWQARRPPRCAGSRR